MGYPQITCACCGRGGRRAAHGWIMACYQRWLTAGRPADGPPPPQATSGAHLARLRSERTAQAAARRTRARELCAAGWGRDAIATEIGVSEDTVRKYTAGVRADVAPTPAPAEPALTPAPVVEEAALHAHHAWTRTIADQIAAGTRPRPPRGWDTAAACRGQDPDAWVPEYPPPLTEIREPCDVCQVAADCLTWALQKPERYGYWASTTPEDRARLRRRIHDARTDQKEDAA